MAYPSFTKYHIFPAKTHPDLTSKSAFDETASARITRQADLAKLHEPANQYRSGTPRAMHLRLMQYATITTATKSTAQGIPAASPTLVLDGLYLGRSDEEVGDAEVVGEAEMLDLVASSELCDVLGVLVFAGGENVGEEEVRVTVGSV